MLLVQNGPLFSQPILTFVFMNSLFYKYLAHCHEQRSLLCMWFMEEKVNSMRTTILLPQTSGSSFFSVSHPWISFLLARPVNIIYQYWLCYWKDWLIIWHLIGILWRCRGILDWTLDFESKGCGFDSCPYLSNFVLQQGTLSTLLLSTQMYKWVPGRMRIRLCVVLFVAILV